MRIASSKSRPTQSSLASVSMNMGRRLAAGYGGYNAAEEGRSSNDWDEDDGEGPFDDPSEDVEGKYHTLYEQRMNPFAEVSVYLYGVCGVLQYSAALRNGCPLCRDIN